MTYTLKYYNIIYNIIVMDGSNNYIRIAKYVLLLNIKWEIGKYTKFWLISVCLGNYLIINLCPHN